MDYFPRNNLEYLAILYLQRIDTSDYSPSDFYKKYQEIYQEMLKAKNSTSKNTQTIRY